MENIRAKWLTFYADHVEPASKEMFGHVQTVRLKVTLFGIRRDKKRLGIQEVTLFGIKLKIVRFSEYIQVIFQS